MKKAELKALETLFSHDIEQAMRPASQPRFPHQSRAKVFRDLEGEGLVKKVSFSYGRPALTVEGWELTTAGHLAYCLSCDGEAA
jgi:hypothetical protein